MKCIWLLAAVILLTTASGLSQQFTAALVGGVTDESGAAVPNVSIRITNLDTNTWREGTTDPGGAYFFSFLQPGTYSVAVHREGFQPIEVASLVLHVAQTTRLDFQLKVGDVNETVEVAAFEASFQTENATLGSVIDSAKIHELPLNGRNFVQLAQLIPGAQAGTPGSITVRRGRGPIGQTDSAFGSTGLSAGGMRDTANRYLLDGVELMDGDASTYAFPPSVDSIAEFKVETSLSSAQSGAAPGAQVNVLTRSGTDEYRGTVWEFNRNDALSSTYDAIAEKKLKPPRLNRNQFGANVGGPLRLPGLHEGSPRTFFFFNWEYGTQALGVTPGLAIVPSDDQREGNLSGLVNARTGEPIALRDPLGVGIVDNGLPVSALNPQAQTFLQFQPRANTQNGVFNYVSSPRSAVSRQENYTVKVDRSLSEQDALWGRYVLNETLEKGTSFWGHDERDNLSRSQNAAIGYVRSISPYMANQVQAGWHFMTESEIFGSSNDPAYDVAGLMGLPLVSRRPEDYGPPTIIVNGPDGSYSMYDLQRQIGPRMRRYSVFQLDETLSWHKGHHVVRAGAELSRRHYYFSQARNARGAFVFDGAYTGSALADFLLGYVKQATINSTPTRTSMSSWQQAYFLTDDWRIASGLTLTLGARYDYFQRWVQDDDKIVNIYQNGFLVTGLVGPNESPHGRSLLAPDRNNFGPRAGFAWRPGLFKDTVVRGGYGIYYQMEHPNANFSMVEGAQATAGGSVIGSSSGIPDVFFSDPFRDVVSSGSLNNTTSIDPDQRDAYIQQWNFTIQHELPRDLVVDVSYVGTKGTRLSVSFDGDGMAFNRPIELVDPRTPGLASLNARRPNPLFQRAVEGVKSIGNSTYHALQVRAERKAARGLTLLTSYTWSKAISGPHDQGGLIGNGSFVGTPQDYYNLHNERSVAAFDQTHRFVQTVMLDLPAFKASSRFGRHLLSGWQVAAIFSAQSGFPAGIDYNVDTTGTGQPSRADVVPGEAPNLPADQRTWKRWFNTDAFAPAQWGHWGTSPRTGAIRLPGQVNLDLSFSKNFPLPGEDRRIQLRTEIFNLMNHFNPPPGSVDRNIQSATFGSVGGGVQGTTTRVVQLGAKLYF